MTELEKVEKLREKANVTFAEAKEALDNSGGDILDALIYLENQGKVTVPAGGGFFSGADSPASSDSATTSDYDEKTQTDSGSGEDFTDLLKRLGTFCLSLLNKGLENHLVASRDGKHLFSCPILVVILALFLFWITIPLFIISLFCGFSYRFTGKELGRDSVNAVMDNASNVAQDVKRSFTDNSNVDDDDEVEKD